MDGNGFSTHGGGTGHSNRGPGLAAVGAKVHVHATPAVAVAEMDARGRAWAAWLAGTRGRGGAPAVDTGPALGLRLGTGAPVQRPAQDVALPPGAEEGSPPGPVDGPPPAPDGVDPAALSPGLPGGVPGGPPDVLRLA